MDNSEKFDLIFNVGKTVCACYTGFTKIEIAYCQQKANWLHLQQFLMSNDPYEALISFSLHPLVDVLSYFQMFIGCLVQFPDENENMRLKNLIMIVDDQNELDDALTNSKMMRALLAINAKYVKSDPCRFFHLFKNCKKLLAHIFKKYPKYFDLNILHTNKKSKALRFRPEEVQIFW